MDLVTFHHDARAGWSVPSFPDLDGSSTLVLVFGSSAVLDAPGPLTELVQAYPRSVVVGCSSAGEIHGDRIRDGSLSVAIVRFEAVKLRAVSVAVGDAISSDRAGERLGRELLAPDLRMLFVLSDGLAVNGTELLGALHRAVPPSVVVTGGLAGDGSRFERTWVLVSGKPVERHIVGVGLYGARLGVSHGSRGGWDAFGPERVVTRAKGNVLYELDGEPALGLYKRYLGDRAAGLPSTALLFPLCLHGREGEGRVVVRTVLSVDEAAQSLTFAGELPEGGIVQLMRANFDRLVDGAGQAAMAADVPVARPSLWIGISCVGRRLVLGERAEEELEATLESVDEQSRLVGFYSYGEISPLVPGTCAVLHNQTMTLTRIWEQ